MSLDPATSMNSLPPTTPSAHQRAARGWVIAMGIAGLTMLGVGCAASPPGERIEGEVATDRGELRADESAASRTPADIHAESEAAMVVATAKEMVERGDDAAAMMLLHDLLDRDPPETEARQARLMLAEIESRMQP